MIGRGYHSNVYLALKALGQGLRLGRSSVEAHAGEIRRRSLFVLFCIVYLFLWSLFVSLFIICLFPFNYVIVMFYFYSSPASHPFCNATPPHLCLIHLMLIWRGCEGASKLI